MNTFILFSLFSILMLWLFLNKDMFVTMHVHNTINMSRCNSCLHNSFFYYFYFFYYYFFFYYSFYNRYIDIYLCLLNSITNMMIFWYMLRHIYGSFSLTPSLSDDMPGSLERGCLHTSPMDAPYLALPLFICFHFLWCFTFLIS